jgi:hypothetical protein
MLTIPAPPRRPCQRRSAAHRWAVALAAAIAAPALAGGPERPPGFLLLEERPSLEGLRVVGVFGAVAEPKPGLWRVQVWEQLRERVTISTDKVNCSTTAPLRIPGRGRHPVVRELNPGGTITPANRLDHLIWWAVCHPEQAGRDPATLAAQARQLGFDGLLPEREQVLPGF